MPTIKDHEWHVFVLNDDTPNAFVIPVTWHVCHIQPYNPCVAVLADWRDIRAHWSIAHNAKYGPVGRCTRARNGAYGTAARSMHFEI